MTWLLKPSKRVVFKKNTVKSAIFQLRYKPVLKIDDNISDFQDQIRTKNYPNYELSNNKRLNVSHSGNYNTIDEKKHIFDKDDFQSSIFLTKDSISLESYKYKNRSIFHEDIITSLESLKKVVGEINSTRLGLRFINQIDKKRISNELKKELDWKDLIDSSFLFPPKSTYTLENTRYLNEVSSNCNEGVMSLRYGLLSNERGEPVFQFDIDRYLENNINVDTIKQILENFSNDIYSLYNEMLTDNLKDWMEPKGNG